METTVVNIMDIERYQFAGVIGWDNKSIPWTDFMNGLESTWILIVVLNFIAFYYMCPCNVFYLFLRFIGTLKMAKEWQEENRNDQ